MRKIHSLLFSYLLRKGKPQHCNTGGDGSKPVKNSANLCGVGVGFGEDCSENPFLACKAKQNNTANIPFAFSVPVVIFWCFMANNRRDSFQIDRDCCLFCLKAYASQSPASGSGQTVEAFHLAVFPFLCRPLFVFLLKMRLLLPLTPFVVDRCIS